MALQAPPALPKIWAFFAPYNFARALDMPKNPFILGLSRLIFCFERKGCRSICVRPFCQNDKFVVRGFLGGYKNVSGAKILKPQISHAKKSA
ncbi:MAG: hypothetical protein J6P03_07915 [Opitutales bacterium]|nr:hypothetical protein [Opitutales bacterium]